jgi:predicted methyltransferase MtxX (methanogen marker protein 4)
MATTAARQQKRARRDARVEIRTPGRLGNPGLGRRVGDDRDAGHAREVSGKADTLGYAIRKKKSSVLRAQKEKFVTQAAERGVAPQVIDRVFAAFQPFER